MESSGYHGHGGGGAAAAQPTAGGVMASGSLEQPTCAPHPPEPIPSVAAQRDSRRGSSGGDVHDGHSDDADGGGSDSSIDDDAPGEALREGHEHAHGSAPGQSHSNGHGHGHMRSYDIDFLNVSLELVASVPLVKVPLVELRPTQMAVGMQQVREKHRNLVASGKLQCKAKKVDKFLRKPKRCIPAIRGPTTSSDGAPSASAYFIVDHHHLSLAFLMAGLQEAYVAVLDDLSHLPVDAFWAAMDSVGRLWRHNARGCPLSLPDFSALVPCSLHELADDPYRSLAAVLRRAGGYVKSRVPYSEFRWANYLRERLPLAAGPGSNEAGGGGDGGGGAAVADAAVVAALPEALRIAEAVDAAAAWRLGLPGRGEQPACSEGRV